MGYGILRPPLWGLRNVNRLWKRFTFFSFTYLSAARLQGNFGPFSSALEDEVREFCNLQDTYRLTAKQCWIYPSSDCCQCLYESCSIFLDLFFFLRLRKIWVKNDMFSIVSLTVILKRVNKSLWRIFRQTFAVHTLLFLITTYTIHQTEVCLIESWITKFKPSHLTNTARYFLE